VVIPHGHPQIVVRNDADLPQDGHGSSVRADTNFCWFGLKMAGTRRRTSWGYDGTIALYVQGLDSLSLPSAPVELGWDLRGYYPRNRNTSQRLRITSAEFRTESANCLCGHTRTAAWLFADNPSGCLQNKLSFPCHVPYLYICPSYRCMQDVQVSYQTACTTVVLLSSMMGGSAVCLFLLHMLIFHSLCFLLVSLQL